MRQDPPRWQYELPGLGLVIHDNPDRASTVAELWPKGGYPPSVGEKLKAATWCPAAGEYVPMDDPERLTISPGLAFMIEGGPIRP